MLQVLLCHLFLLIHEVIVQFFDNFNISPSFPLIFSHENSLHLIVSSVRSCCCCYSVASDTFETLWTPSSPPGSSVHGISQATILERTAISFFRESSPPRDRTCISCISRQILYPRTPWEVPGMLLRTGIYCVKKSRIQSIPVRLLL